jgi:peptidoglycan/LPS O-acetylase OafA/YrhL
MQRSYRHDIDGLRAIAVLAVFAFHLGIAPFGGGYVGVDIFYVISGFVIFRGILAEQADGRYSVRVFYRRRIRRIFPALAVVILFTLAGGLPFLTPEGYVDLAYTALAAVFSVSNVYFFDRSGYFAEAAGNIPLLHTWSLGVEEQFYLLLPLALLAAHRLAGPRPLLRVLGTVAVLSFLYNLVAVHALGELNHAFYLPMARLWEIAVGGLLALLERHGPARHHPGADFAALAGLAGLLAATVWLDAGTPFPGLAAALPVAATALVIHAAPAPGSLGQRLLTAPPMRFLGQISYSLYLFHWPLIVFAGLYAGRDLLGHEKAGLFGLAVLLAALSWRFVEQPFRRARGAEAWRRQRSALGLAALLLVAACGIALWQGGFPQRLNPAARQAIHALAAERAAAPPCRPLSGLGAVPEAARLCSPYPAEKIDYLVWGDSHARMLGPGLGAALHDLGRSGVVASMPDCAPLLGVHTSETKNRAACAELGGWVVDRLRAARDPVVILAGRWANLASPVAAPGDGRPPKALYDSEAGGAPIPFAAALERTVRRLAGAGARVVVVGPVPELPFDVPDMLVRTLDWGRPLPVVPRAGFERRQSQVLPALAAVAGLPGVAVVYPHDVLCDARQCRVAAGQLALYVDDDHLSPAGVRRVAPAIVAAMQATR